MADTETIEVEVPVQPSVAEVATDAARAAGAAETAAAAAVESSSKLDEVKEDQEEGAEWLEEQFQRLNVALTAVQESNLALRQTAATIVDLITQAIAMFQSQQVSENQNMPEEAEVKKEIPEVPNS